MVLAKVRRSGNSFIVTVPHEEVERLHLTEGQMVTLEVRTVDIQPELSPDWQAVFDDVYPRIEPGLRYLADR